MSDIPPQASTDAQAAQAPMQQHEQSSMSASGQPAQLSPEGENGQASGPSGAAANSNMSGPSGPSSGGPGPAGGPPAPAGQAPLDSQAIRHMNEVLASDIGVATMLTRLKASIASAKEFALFLRKRASIEEEHSSALRKLCRTTQANMHGSGEHRGGSFARAYDEMIFIHERLADNGSRFATSLHQMHDDLWELAAAAERGRKAWKANGLQAENRVVEIESQLRKSKAKYDALADEYERVRAGEAPGPSASGSGGSKLLGALKGATKSAAHHEEDLFRKVQGADSEYFQKVQSLQSERADLVAKTRPEAVRALQDIVKETDAGLTLQLQKYASFNEKLLLSNGLSISPIKNQTDGGAGGVAQQARGLREAVLSIDNDRDLVEYVASWYSKLPPRTAEIKYERNAVLNPQPGPFGPGGPGAPQQQQQPGGPRQPGPMQYPPPGAQFGPGGQPQQFNMSGGIGAPPPGQQPPPGWAGPGGPFQQQQQQQFGLPQAGPAPPPVIPAAAQQGQRPSSRHRGSGQQHERSFSASTLLSRVSGLTGGGDKSQPSRNSAGAQSGGGAVGIGSGPINAPGPAGPPAPMQHQMYQQPSQQQPSQQQPQGPPQLAPLRFDAESSVQGAGAANQQQQELPLHQRQQQVLPGNPLQQHPPATAASPPQPPALQSATSQPSQPVFGVSLARLYERDGLAVPMVVYQCIQAVDLFGLNVEGIYRLSASAPNVTKLQQLFDNAGPNGVNSGRLDFRNPEHFFHDVNSVAVLLKTFLRELPDPLLTSEHYTAFIEAAKQDDDTVRRDSLHAIINGLPDPNYATLRALTLHLHRVMSHAAVNRMGSQNLAIVFGPTLMGTASPANIADAGWQVRVVDTIIQNTFQIFDDD